MSTPPLERPRTAEALRIPVGSCLLAADLAIPEPSRAFVIFAHGSGSGRLSSRNRQIADVLAGSAIATLLPGLLSQEEEEKRGGRLRFDLTLLASRLVAVYQWARRMPQLQSLPVGLVGAGTGAGVALLAAAQQPRDFGAIVTRGGRPDLAGSALRRVMAPTLLIVGERDDQLLDLNIRAAERMLTDVRVESVPGATHFFEEAGALARVAQLTGDWFRAHLTGG